MNNNLILWRKSFEASENGEEIDLYKLIPEDQSPEKMKVKFEHGWESEGKWEESAASFLPDQRQCLEAGGLMERREDFKSGEFSEICHNPI